MLKVVWEWQLVVLLEADPDNGAVNVVFEIGGRPLQQGAEGNCWVGMVWRRRPQPLRGLV